MGKLALRLAIYAGGRDEVYPKTLELTKDGVDEVMFEPFEVPEGDSIRLTLTGAVGDVERRAGGRGADPAVGRARSSPPNRAPAARARRSSSGLPAGRTYESPEMLIVLSPTLERMLIELALGDDAYPAIERLEHRTRRADLCRRPYTTADRAADLLAATVGACSICATPARPPRPRPQRLTGAIQGLVAALDRRAEPGWRLALGQRRSRAPRRARSSRPRRRATG